MKKALSSVLAPFKPGIVVHTSDPRSEEVGAGGKKDRTKTMPSKIWRKQLPGWHEGRTEHNRTPPSGALCKRRAVIVTG